MTRKPLMIAAVGLLLAANPPQDSTKTDKLKPPQGQVAVLRVRAKGVQVYESKAKGRGFEWTLKEPRADLFDDKGAKVGKHFRDADLAGPAWESEDGSKVVAATPPLHSEPKDGTIPWLLLKAKANAGNGVFSKVTYIQRVDTRGGKAPSRAPSEVDETAEVRYEAAYVFYGSR